MIIRARQSIRLSDSVYAIIEREALAVQVIIEHAECSSLVLEFSFYTNY